MYCEHALEAIHPDLPKYYDEHIRRVHYPKAHGRNAFLNSTIPFLHSAVSEEIGLRFSQQYYEDNASIYEASLETHQKEALCLWQGCEQTFKDKLSPTELKIYEALTRNQRDAFRICRHLALECNERTPKTAFFLSYHNLSMRLGKKDDHAGSHLLKALCTLEVLCLTKKGTAHAPGARGKAGEYRWLVV